MSLRAETTLVKLNVILNRVRAVLERLGQSFVSVVLSERCTKVVQIVLQNKMAYELGDSNAVCVLG
jgi:hypothetical protein